MKRILLSATIVAGAMYFAPTAHAGPSGLVTCPETGFTQEPNAKVENSGGNTSATAKCQYLTPPSQNNVASISNINLAGFFGPYAMGWIKDATGSFEGGLLVIAALVVVSLIATLILPHNRALERAPAPAE